MPIIILAGTRTRKLSRLLASVGNQPGVYVNSILVVSNLINREIIQLSTILGFKLLFHKTDTEEEKARIANNLQFGLYHGLKSFPEAEYYIVLEEDLVLAPDFYSYMSHFAPLLHLDPTILAVSAFNHLSFPHTGLDPSKAYRVSTFPAYGWMTSRETVNFLVPKFLPETVNQDWDYFMGINLITRGREIVVPDINRSYHWTTGGVHNSGSLQAEELYLSRTLNEQEDVSYIPLDRLTQKNYEAEFRDLLSEAVTLKVKSDLSGFTTNIVEGGVYKLFVYKKSERDDTTFQNVGEMLQIWNLDSREHHNHAWRLFYEKATLFVIGIPISPYRTYRKEGEPYVKITEKYDMSLHFYEVYSQTNLTTHISNYLLPDTD